MSEEEAEEELDMDSWKREEGERGEPEDFSPLEEEQPRWFVFWTSSGPCAGHTLAQDTPLSIAHQIAMTPLR